MAKSSLSVDFKSTNVYALKLVLLSDDTETILADLAKRINDAGDFYSNEAIVIDITNLESTPDWSSLIKALKNYQLHPIGIETNSHLEAACKDSGLAILFTEKTTATKTAKANETFSAAPKVNKTDTTSQAASVDKTSTRKTLVINKPLRSGQSIYAKGSDLVVIGMVSKGAEIIADGNIHVYGPLRGKAIAGASGDTQALILTTQLDPELLAIAGVYRVVETDLPKELHNHSAKIELSGGTLKFQSLK